MNSTNDMVATPKSCATSNMELVNSDSSVTPVKCLEVYVCPHGSSETHITDVELPLVLGGLDLPLDSNIQLHDLHLNHRPSTFLTSGVKTLEVFGEEKAFYYVQFRTNEYFVVFFDVSAPILDSWWYLYRKFSRVCKDTSLLSGLLKFYCDRVSPTSGTTESNLFVHLGAFLNILGGLTMRSDALGRMTAKSAPLSIDTVYEIPGVPAFGKYTRFLVAAVSHLEKTPSGAFSKWLQFRSALTGSLVIETLKSALDNRMITVIDHDFLRVYVTTLLERASSVVNESQAKPAVFLLQGLPGVGKTTFVHELARLLGLGPEEIYFRKAQADHGRWNGYNGQAITIFDDLFQGGVAAVQRDFMELCTTLGTQIISGSSLAEKNMLFISPIIFVTCNEFVFGKGVNAEAFLRRIDVALTVEGDVSRRRFCVHDNQQTLKYKMDSTQSTALILTSLFESEKWSSLYASSVEESVIPDWSFYTKNYFNPPSFDLAECAIPSEYTPIYQTCEPVSWEQFAKYWYDKVPKYILCAYFHLYKPNSFAEDYFNPLLSKFTLSYCGLYFTVAEKTGSDGWAQTIEKQYFEYRNDGPLQTKVNDKWLKIDHDVSLLFAKSLLDDSSSTNLV